LSYAVVFLFLVVIWGYGVNAVVCLLCNILRLYNHRIDLYVDNMDPVGFTGMLNYLFLSMMCWGDFM